MSAGQSPSLRQPTHAFVVGSQCAGLEQGSTPSCIEHAPAAQ